jgi:hypothetical protein
MVITFKQNGGALLANELAQKIEKLLEPIVGDFIAKAAVKAQCKSIGTTPDDLNPQHLEALSKKIEAAIKIYGHDATEIGEKIRKLI